MLHPEVYFLRCLAAAHALAGMAAGDCGPEVCRPASIFIAVGAVYLSRTVVVSSAPALPFLLLLLLLPPPLPFPPHSCDHY